MTSGHHGLDSLPEITRKRLVAFGAMVRAERERRGLSTRGAADQLGLSFATVSRMETGASLPDMATFLVFAAWVGMPLSWFDAPQGEGIDAWQAGWDDCAAAVGAVLKRGGGA